MTFSSTVFNFLAVSVVTAGANGVVVGDSAGNVWTVVTQGSHNLAYTFNAAAITYVTITSQAPFEQAVTGAVGEWSGVSTAIVGSAIHNGVPTSPWTISQSLTGSTDYLIAGGGTDSNIGSPTISVNTGSQAAVGNVETFTAGGAPQSWIQAFLMYNTGSGTVTCAMNTSPVGGGLNEALAIEISPATAPTVTTQAATSITSATATANGTITSIGSANASIEGVVYNTSSFSPTAGSVPNTWGTVVSSSGSFGVGAFTEALTGLTGGVTYFYAAFAANSGGYSYGSVVSFTTNAGASAHLLSCIGGGS